MQYPTLGSKDRMDRESGKLKKIIGKVQSTVIRGQERPSMSIITGEWKFYGEWRVREAWAERQS